jgi:hypothetical protein
MITFRINADIRDDRRVVLVLPSEVPTGQAELTVMIEQPVSVSRRDQVGAAEWVEERTGLNGDEAVRYPLHGSVVRYERPTEPVAVGDWEALQ